MTERTCCGKTEREHPTWPVYSDHPFGQPNPTEAQLAAAWRDYYAKPENMAALNEQVREARSEMDAAAPLHAAIRQQSKEAVAQMQDWPERMKRNVPPELTEGAAPRAEGHDHKVNAGCFPSCPAHYSRGAAPRAEGLARAIHAAAETHGYKVTFPIGGSWTQLAEAAEAAQGAAPLDWWKRIGEWVHDHADYTKDRPDTIEVQRLYAFLDELATEGAAPRAEGLTDNDHLLAMLDVASLYKSQHDDECNCEACNAFEAATDEVEPAGAAPRAEGLDGNTLRDLTEIVGKALYGWGDDEPNAATGHTALIEVASIATAVYEAGYRRLAPQERRDKEGTE